MKLPNRLTQSDYISAYIEVGSKPFYFATPIPAVAVLKNANECVENDLAKVILKLNPKLNGI